MLGDLEFFQSDGSKLIKRNPTYNKVTLKNTNGRPILYLYFDKVDRDKIYIQPYSTGETNSDGELSFKVFDSNE